MPPPSRRAATQPHDPSLATAATVASLATATAAVAPSCRPLTHQLAQACGPRHEHTHGWAARPRPSCDSDCWDITLRPPPATPDTSPPAEQPGTEPYKGCRFRLSVDGAATATPTWVWRSPIYHPLLSEGSELCQCLQHRAKQLDATDELAGMVAVVRQLLRPPALWPPCCPQCTPSSVPWTEAVSDPAFFCRKARCRTPGAAPLADAEIMRGTPTAQSRAQVFGSLLRSGAYSDVKIVVGAADDKASFACHRTVLAGASRMFKHLFNSTVDRGELRLNRTRPKTFARFLQYCYTADIPGAARLTAPQLLELGSLAYACKVEPLRQFAASMLRRRLTVENVTDLLLLNQQHKEPTHTDTLLQFLEQHLRAVLATEGWPRLLLKLQGVNPVGAMLRALQRFHVLQTGGAGGAMKENRAIAKQQRAPHPYHRARPRLEAVAAPANGAL